MSLLSHDPTSREYVLGRLDREHIAELADQAQTCLRELGRAVERTMQRTNLEQHPVLKGGNGSAHVAR